MLEGVRVAELEVMETVGSMWDLERVWGLGGITREMKVREREAIKGEDAMHHLYM
jgi:hypothetical protein